MWKIVSLPLSNTPMTNKEGHPEFITITLIIFLILFPFMNWYVIRNGAN